MISLNKIARIVSLILIPTFFNLISFIYITFNYENDPANQFYSILLALIFGSVIPIAIFIRFRQKGTIRDADATVRSERDLPYLIAFALCLNAMVISMFLNLHPYLIYLWLVYAIISILIYIINKYWKISAHSIGAAIPLGILIFTQSSLAFVFLPIRRFSRMG